MELSELVALVKQHTHHWPNKSNKSRGELHGDCPKCGGEANSDRFWMSNGKGYCRQCDKGFESVTGFYEFIGQPNPNQNGNGSKPIDKRGMDRAPDEPPKPSQSFATLAEYAAHQGAPEEAFIKARCHIVQWGGKPHIAFPCSDGYNRLRVMDGRKPKWVPQKKKDDPHKITPQLYGWARALNIHTEEQSPLVLTNGQPSVIVAQHFGIAAFCLTDGENKPIPDAAISRLLEQLKLHTPIFICKDADKAGRDGTRQAYKQLYRYEPTVIQFPGDDGYDLANHCKKYGEHALKELKQFETEIALDLPKEQIADLSKQVAQLARTIKQQDGEAVKQITLERLQAQIEVLSSTNTELQFVSNPGEEVYKLFQERVKNPTAVTGLRSGHTQLDRAIGGFNLGAVHRVLGETKSGKTQLCATWARSLMTETPGLIVSFECGNGEFVNRMVASDCRLPFGSLTKGGQLVKDAFGKWEFIRFVEEEINRARRAYGTLQTFDRLDRVKFLKPGSYSPRHLLMAAKAAKDKFGIQWMIIDSLNNVLTPGRSQQESMALAAINSESIAQQCNIAVIDTAQGGRATKGRTDKRLGTHDGKWSSELEEKASAHMSLYHHWKLIENGELTEKQGDDVKYPKGTAELRINVVRHTGMGSSKITLKYIGGCGFYNHDDRR